jgi:FkbM family methyltransferase
MNRWLTSTVEAYKLNFGYTDHPIVWDVGSSDGVELAERIFTGNADVALQNSFVVCVEPNPPQARLIRETFPQVTVHEVAVSDWEGTSDFVRVVSDNMDAVGMSSLDVAHQETKGHWAKEIITVKVTRLDSLMPTSPVDIMKIDCEGYSWEVLHGMGEKLHNVRVFHIETEHPEFSGWSHKGHKNNEQVMAFMESKGFLLYKTEYEWGGIQDQVWVNKNINRTGINKTPSAN